jgi:hypothetical protein
LINWSILQSKLESLASKWNNVVVGDFEAHDIGFVSLQEGFDTTTSGGWVTAEEYALENMHEPTPPKPRR